MYTDEASLSAFLDMPTLMSLSGVLGDGKEEKDMFAGTAFDTN